MYRFFHKYLPPTLAKIVMVLCIWALLTLIFVSAYVGQANFTYLGL